MLLNKGTTGPLEWTVEGRRQRGKGQTCPFPTPGVLTTCSPKTAFVWVTCHI